MLRLTSYQDLSTSSVTDFDANGKPTVDFFANRIHPRFGYRWRHPIHEVIVPYEKDLTETFFEIGCRSTIILTTTSLVVSIYQC